MSDELRLPDDLAAMEARLAAHAPPASGLNRDELIYRAGWAACQAQRFTSDSPPSKGGVRGGIPDAAMTTNASGGTALSLPPLTQPLPSGERGRIAAWSCASAALAASIAVAMTLLIQPSEPPQLAVRVVAPAPATLADAPATDSPSANQPDAARVAAYLAVIDDAGRRPSSEPLFAASMLKRSASRPSSPAGSAVVVDEPAPSPKTARELQQELLPSGHRSSSPAAQSALGWPWNSHLWGETI